MPFFDSDAETQVSFGDTEITGSDSNKAAILLAGVTPTNTASFLKTSEDGTLEITGSVSVDAIATITDPVTVTGSVVLGEQPIDVTGSVGITQAPPLTIGSFTTTASVSIEESNVTLDVTGTVGVTSIASPVTIDNFPAVQTITGSVVLGEEPIEITGSLSIDSIGAVVDVTGSVVLGEQPINITGSMGISEIVDITGSVGVTSVASPVVVTQGDAGSQNEGWYARITDGIQVLGTGSSAPFYVTGSVLSYIEATGSRGSIKIEDGAGTGNVATVIEDVDTSADKRLLVEADIKPGASVNIVTTEPTTDIFIKKLENTGSSDMVVNGSSTPRQFIVTSSATQDIQITELRLVFVSNNIQFDGGSFGKGGGDLTNGVAIRTIINGGDSIPISTLTINENFLELASNTGLNVILGQGGSNDVLATSFIFGGKVLLQSGSSDSVAITIRDNLTAGARDIKYFQATLFGKFEA